MAVSYIVIPKQIDEIFKNFKNKNPFNLKSRLKIIKKKYKNIDDDSFYEKLILEINTCCKNGKSIVIYSSPINNKINIIKFRMKDSSIPFGKSYGWRLIALLDEVNDLFYLLDIYSHSEGKDNIDANEKKSIKKNL
ncbi:MAG: hypothetical protein SO253_06470 [Bacilli bacterium]|nr:hypothetical protein [Bacilli bacterium]